MKSVIPTKSVYKYSNFLFLMTAVICPTKAVCQSLAIDTGFGTAGKVVNVINPDSQGEIAFAVAAQADGKIVIAGRRSAILRINPNGTLDTSFASTGQTYTVVNSFAESTALAVQTDGKILVANQTGLYRYLNTGAFDTSFGIAGKAILSVSPSGMQLQSDGKIVVSGVCSGTKFCVQRLNLDGNSDLSFNTTGLTTQVIGNNNNDQATAMRIQSDGRVVVAGTCSQMIGVTPRNQVCAMRLMPNGTLDTSFGSGAGVVNYPILTSSDVFGMTIQASGKLVLAGSCGQTFAKENTCAYRLNTDGSLDTSFNTTGFSNVNLSAVNGGEEGRAVENLPLGKLLVSGLCPDTYGHTFCITRLNTNGTLDTTFGSSGLLRAAVGTIQGAFHSGAYASVTQPSGRIVIVGMCNSNGSMFGDYCATRLRTFQISPPPGPPPPPPPN